MVRTRWCNALLDPALALSWQRGGGVMLREWVVIRQKVMVHGPWLGEGFMLLINLCVDELML
jgi:hypothetical protein